MNKAYYARVEGKSRKVKPADYFKELTEIVLPAGVGQHTWEVRPRSVILLKNAPPSNLLMVFVEA
jgi:hypothetical protein